MGLVMNHLTRPESPASEPQQTFLFDLGQSNGGQHLRVTDHRASHGRTFDDVVLLNYRQNITAKLPHLAVVFLDNLGPTVTSCFYSKQ
jgi:hypothetical protein